MRCYAATPLMIDLIDAAIRPRCLPLIITFTIRLLLIAAIERHAMLRAPCHATSSAIILLI